jgi:hypothetical protein
MLALAEALKKRKRVWGQRNAAVLEQLRNDKLATKTWPTRPLRALGSGAYLTRIPSAA